ncbi:MAG: hypothetical protein ACRD2U_12320 [Terriglobales bacterium]
MKVRTLALSLALCFVAAMCVAESPMMGTWKLNEAKSKFGPGAEKNTTVVYEAAGDSVKVTVDGATADGTPVHSEWTGKFDGKDYPVTGDPGGDMRMYKQINSHTLLIKDKKDGKITETIRIVISPDGKTRTVTMHGMDAMGKKVSSMSVYDKE